MFLRSACWGGQPSFFYGRNSTPKYRMFLEKAKEANINNLRIFGWHPAETDEFYTICDQLGITVWTNFSFATQEFKTDQPYIEKVTKEIQSTVIKRRNHPSNIMWMGGEEVYFTEAHVESGNKQLMEYIGEVTHQLTNTPMQMLLRLVPAKRSVWVMPQKNQCMRTHITMLPGQFLWKIIILTWTMLLSLNSLPLQHPILTV